MSQFSESLHFHGTPTELLSSCSVVPVVVGKNELWTTFLPYAAGSDKTPILVDGLVVLWRYAEDHGWDMQVRHGELEVFTYSQSWDPSPRPAKSSGSASRAAELLGWELTRFRSLLPDTPADHGGGADNAYGFAAALKLPVTDWLSPENIRDVSGCTECPVISPIDRGPWTCPNCGGTEPMPYPPEPERAPAAPSAEALRTAALREQLRSSLQEAVERSLLELVPDTNLDELTDELLTAMAEVAVAPNRGAALAEWLLEHDEIEEVFGTDEEIMDAFK
ncbi:MAG: hypothetical protein ACI9KE_004908 [Polyangiales bacterium]|jgi:hypothetical protein